MLQLRRFQKLAELFIGLNVEVLAERPQILVERPPDFGLRVAKVSLLFVVEHGLAEHLVDLVDHALGNSRAFTADQLKELSLEKFGRALGCESEQIPFDEL